MDETKVCRRTPQDGDVPGATCPDCPHVIGSHVEDYCPLCVIVAQVDGITTAIAVNTEAVTREFAISMGNVLADVARHMISLGDVLTNALSAPAEPRPGEWAQDTSDATATLRAGTVIEVTDPR